MGRKSNWTPEVVQFIKDNAATLKDKELAEKVSELLGKPVSMQSVRKQRQKVGVVKAAGRGKCSVVAVPSTYVPGTTTTTTCENTTSVAAPQGAANPILPSTTEV
jgi:hypothetical protein